MNASKVFIFGMLTAALLAVGCGASDDDSTSSRDRGASGSSGSSGSREDDEGSEPEPGASSSGGSSSGGSSSGGSCAPTGGGCSFSIQCCSNSCNQSEGVCL